MLWQSLAVLLAIWLAVCGCSTANYYDQRIDRAEDFAIKGQWKDAYVNISPAFGVWKEKDRIDYLLNRFPLILTIGVKDAFLGQLNDVENICKNKSFPDKSLKISSYFNELTQLYHNKYVTSDVRQLIYENSKEALNSCAKIPEAEFDLSEIEKFEGVAGSGYFSNTVKQIVVESSKTRRMAATGTIINVQVENHSQLNTGTGAQVGSLYGQAQYIDNTSIGGYSASKQVGAGVVGAIVGGALLDTPSKPFFKIAYFIKSLSGDVRAYNHVSVSPTHIPVGVCVETGGIDGIKIVSQKFCASPESWSSLDISSPELQAQKPHTKKIEQLGLVIADVDNANVALSGEKDDPGVRVVDVIPGSPANIAGVQKEDLIIELNQQPVVNLATFQALYESHREKKALSLFVKRAGKSRFFGIRNL